jgi:hypothetical protein
MISEMPVKLKEIFQELDAVPADNYQNRSEIRNKFYAVLSGNSSLIEAIYDAYFQCLRVILINDYEFRDIDQILAYKFITLFSSPSTSMPGDVRAGFFRVLSERHREHKELLEVALSSIDRCISPIHGHRKTGNLSDIPTAMLEAYCWHRPYSVEAPEIDADLRPMIAKLFRAFPEQTSLVLGGMLADDTDGSVLVSDLLRFYILERKDVTEGPMRSFAYDMLGHYARKTNTLHAKAADIVALTLRDATSWSLETTTDFVEKFLLKTLNVEATKQAAEIARMRDTVERQEHRISSTQYKKENFMSADELRKRDVENLEKYKKELALIESDFGRWDQQRWTIAVRRVAVSVGTRKALKVSIQRLPLISCVRLAALLNDADNYRNQPKKYPMPKASDNRFKDFGLKLLVIEELMYRQKILTPAFDIHEFAKEYDKREIDIETDGYNIIPEAKKYFQNLDIPNELLVKVETLHQSSGIDGGSRFMYQIFPFWDPGVGDDVVRITNKAIDDFALLPSLRRFSGLENSKPSPKLLKSLKDKGVQVLNEERI